MRRVGKLIERCLWAVGLLALGACALVWLHARLEQHLGNQELDRRIVSAEKTNQSPPTKHAPAYDTVIGRIQIPRLALSAVVFEGTDSPVLEHGIGHLTASHLPGESGNVVFAGHRDTFFRALKNIQPHDLINVTTEEGTRRYVVQSTEIVNPDQTGVLHDTSRPTLTLITCYPFHYVGHAPKRFIVRCGELVQQKATAPVVHAAVPATATPAPVKPAAVAISPVLIRPVLMSPVLLNPARLIAVIVHEFTR